MPRNISGATALTPPTMPHRQGHTAERAHADGNRNRRRRPRARDSPATAGPEGATSAAAAADAGRRHARRATSPAPLQRAWTGRAAAFVRACAPRPCSPIQPRNAHDGGAADQPCSAPIDSNSAPQRLSVGVDSRVRHPSCNEPPAHSGSVGNGCDGRVIGRPDETIGCCNVSIAHPRQRDLDRVVVMHQATIGVRDMRGDVVLAAHHIVLQRVHQRRCQRPWQRGDQIHPVRGQPRSQHRHRDRDTLAQARDCGVSAAHLGVGECFGAADVEGPAHVWRATQPRLVR